MRGKCRRRMPTLMHRIRRRLRRAFASIKVGLQPSKASCHVCRRAIYGTPCWSIHPFTMHAFLLVFSCYIVHHIHVPGFVHGDDLGAVHFLNIQHLYPVANREVMPFIKVASCLFYKRWRSLKEVDRATVSGVLQHTHTHTHIHAHTYGNGLHRAPPAHGLQPPPLENGCEYPKLEYL